MSAVSIAQQLNKRLTHHPVKLCLDTETTAAAAAAAAAAVMQVSRTTAAATTASTGVDGVGESLSVGAKFIAGRQRRATIPLSSRRCVL